MSASNPHLRLSPVRACVLLIVVYLTVCAALLAEDVKLSTPSELSRMFPTLFAEEKPPAQSELSPSSSTLFAEKKPPARREWSDSLQPQEVVRFRTQRTQRTQRPGDDRVQAFYDSLDTLKVQQKRDEDQKARDAQRRSRRSPPMHYGHGRRK